MADGRGWQVLSFAWSAHGNVWSCPNCGGLDPEPQLSDSGNKQLSVLSHLGHLGNLGQAPGPLCTPFPLLQNAGGLRLACGSKSLGVVLLSTASVLPHCPPGFPTWQICVGAWSMCVFNMFPGHADAAVWEPHFERARYAQTFERWTLIMTHCFKKSTVWWDWRYSLGGKKKKKKNLPLHSRAGVEGKHLRVPGRDFPGDPVAKTPRSQCRGSRFDPWSGN